MNRHLMSLAFLSAAISCAQAQTYAGFDRLAKQSVSGVSLGAATGDIDNDGDMDIVICKNIAGSGEITVMVNNGTGLFAEGQPLSLTGVPVYVVLCDTNNDGRLDIVASVPNLDSLITWRGSFGATFLSPVITAVPSDPQGIVAADFNGDGRDDIAVAMRNDDEVRVYFSDGIGFPTVQVISTAGLGGAGDEPYDVDVGDLNLDGFLDIVSVNRTSEDLGVYYGLSNGGFLGGFFGTFIPTGRTPFDVKVANIDSGPAPDIVYTESFSGSDGARIGWLRNEWDGGFEPFPNFDDTLFLTNLGGRVVDIVTADIDCDGDNFADVICADEWFDTRGIDILTADDTAPFTLRPRFSFSGTFDRPRSITAADYDGDGDTDFVLHDLAFSNNFTVYLNRCAGSNCPADVTGDGMLTFFDISTYLGWYNSGDSRADIASPAGTLNFFDVSEYISLYNAGCP